MWSKHFTYRNLSLQKWSTMNELVWCHMRLVKLVPHITSQIARKSRWKTLQKTAETTKQKTHHKTTNWRDMKSKVKWEYVSKCEEFIFLHISEIFFKMCSDLLTFWKSVDLCWADFFTYCKSNNFLRYCVDIRKCVEITSQTIQKRELRWWPYSRDPLFT